MTPRRFKLHVSNFEEPFGRVWTVQYRGKYMLARHVDVQDVKLKTVFKGATARQPKVWLEGYGVVRRKPDATPEISAS